MMDKKTQEAIKDIFEKYRLCKYLQNSFEYQRYCELIENIVESLPSKEKQLITERYLVNDGDYLTDEVVYKERLTPSISAATYSKIRDKAFYHFIIKLQMT
jgi:hypothetical protein